MASVQILAFQAPFLTDGTSVGSFTVTNPFPYKTGSKAIISSSTVAPLEVIIQSVNVITATVTVWDASGKAPANLSAYLQADTAVVNVPDQLLNYKFNEVDISRQTTPLLVHLDGAPPPGAGGATEATLSVIRAQQVDGTQSTNVINFPATQPVSAVALPLPAGAATEASLHDIDLDIDLIRDTLLDGSQLAQVTNWPVVQPISAAALPLPTGAASETNLSAVKTDLDNIYIRQADGNQKSQVTNWPVTQPVSVASLPLPTGAATEATIAARLPALGQKTAAGSVPVTMASNQNAISVSVTENLDAFSRIRTVNPSTLFDSKLTEDNAPLLWDDQQTTGSGTSSTWNTNQASVTLAVANLTAGTRVRQSFKRMHYIPGKTQAIFMSGILGAPTAGNTKRIGYFDSQNGLFFQSNPSTVSIAVRTFTGGSANDISVPQASWNLDPMNGTGPSGISLDWTKTQIFCIQFQWLGVGSVWYGFDIGGKIYWAHRTDNANRLSLVYMSNPNLPVRYEISNDGTGPVDSMLQICSTVISEGGQDHLSIARTMYRTAVMSAANNTNWYPLLSFRLRTGFLNNDVVLQKINITCPTNATYIWRLVLNPTVAGAALAFTPIANSSVEFDGVSTGATTITGGTDLDAGVVTESTESTNVTIQPSALRLGVSIAGVSDIVVLAVSRVVGGAEDYYATLGFTDRT